MAHASVTTNERSYAGNVARVLLVLAGSLAVAVGAFRPWSGDIAATRIPLRGLVRTTFAPTDVFLGSVGALMIGLALLGVLGLALTSGWLVRLAGCAAIIVLGLFAVEVYRAHAGGTLQEGVWISLAGAVVVVIAGFVGRYRTTERVTPVTPVIPE